MDDMDKMDCDFSDIQRKYSNRGLCRFQRFKAIVDTHYNPFPIGSHCNIGSWFLDVKKVMKDGELYIIPYIYCNNTKDYVQIRISYYLNPVNHLGKNMEKYKNEGICYWNMKNPIYGRKMILVSDILDEKNGWLMENGTFGIRVGINVESLLLPDGIRIFNLFDAMFHNPMINVGNNDIKAYLYCHAQLMNTYSPNILEICERGLQHSYRHLGEALQILHGVNLRLSEKNLQGIIRLAYALELSNVLRYCEWRLCRKLKSSKGIEKKFEFAIEYNLHHYLAHLLRKERSLEKIKRILRDVDIQKMSSQCMSMIIGKLIYDLF